MEAFINSIIVLFVLYLFSNFFPKEKQGLFFCVCAGVFLALFSGLRDWTTSGVDLYRYNNTYEVLKNASLQQALDMRGGTNMFYYMVCRLCSTLGIQFQLFIFLISVTFVGTYAIFVYKFTTHHLLSFFLFLGMGCFTFSFSGLKQTIAMTLVMWSFMLYKKNTLNSYLLLVFAMFFHPTAIVMIPIYVISKLKITKFLLLIMILGLVLIFIYRMQIGAALTLLFDSDYMGRYESMGRVSGKALIVILFAIHYLMFRPSLVQKSEMGEIRDSIIIMILIMACGFQLCASYSYAFTRINLYYMLFLPIAISDTLESEKWKKIIKGLKLQTLVYYIIISFYMIQLYLVHVLGESLEYYKFCLS